MILWTVCGGFPSPICRRHNEPTIVKRLARLGGDHMARPYSLWATDFAVDDRNICKYVINTCVKCPNSMFGWCVGGITSTPPPQALSRSLTPTPQDQPLNSFTLRITQPPEHESTPKSGTETGTEAARVKRRTCRRMQMLSRTRPTAPRSGIRRRRRERKEGASSAHILPGGCDRRL